MRSQEENTNLEVGQDYTHDFPGNFTFNDPWVKCRCRCVPRKISWEIDKICLCPCRPRKIELCCRSCGCAPILVCPHCRWGCKCMPIPIKSKCHCSNETKTTEKPCPTTSTTTTLFTTSKTTTKEIVWTKICIVSLEYKSTLYKLHTQIHVAFGS